MISLFVQKSLLMFSHVKQAVIMIPWGLSMREAVISWNLKILYLKVILDNHFALYTVYKRITDIFFTQCLKFIISQSDKTYLIRQHKRCLTQSDNWWTTATYFLFLMNWTFIIFWYLRCHFQHCRPQDKISKYTLMTVNTFYPWF